VFYFYHSEQTQENASYFKGLLFERLLKRYLEELGFKIELRQKRNSLEYDLEGAAILDGRRLFGEAKAHGKPISGEVFTSFVGKLFPLHSKDPQLTGVFLSSSALTPDAEDYRRSLDETSLNLKVLTGDKLLSDIETALHLPASPTIGHVAEKLNLFPLSLHLLATDHGQFALQVCAAEGGATPSAFFLVREDGQVVSDMSFLQTIKLNITDLEELEPRASFQSQPTSRKEIPEGVIVGNDWADYRLPAPPQFFVGREEVVGRILGSFTGATNPGVVQLKSRSGVGKSSLMAFLAQHLRDAGLSVQLYDARNIKSVLDVWSVVQRFTGSASAPTDSGDVEGQLRSLQSRAVRSVLIIDQFEYTFGNAELFEAYEMLALAAVQLRPMVNILFARKNDLLTTFDNTRISLERLNDLSESIVLEDFRPDEAVELIGQISRNSGKPVSQEVKAYVLEFAQGFPWLLKRTMAHVLKLRTKGGNPAELMPSALGLDDLFDEELEELDELERDYLVRITQRLPATYQELDRYFDEDPYLPGILEKLSSDRLLRLSGSTYDTYNDVFKEYLIYHRLPDFRLSYVYRLGPVMVLGAFRKIAEMNKFTNEELGHELDKARGTTFNLLRELRNHGLVDRDGDGWVVPDPVMDAMSRNRLGEYIRQQLVKNGLVADLLSHLHSKGFMRAGETPGFLQRVFPFVTASGETWSNYSKLLLSWLTTVRLVALNEERVEVTKEDRSVIAKEIGNLRQKFRSRGRSRHFLPGAYWIHVEEAFKQIRIGNVANLTTKQRDALRSLIELQVCTENGSCKAGSLEELRTLISSAMDQEPYKSFWERARAGGDLGGLIVEKCGLVGLERSTVHWRERLIVNWGRALGKLSTSRMRRTKKLEFPLLDFPST
jgi:hypothetical protein